VGSLGRIGRVITLCSLGLIALGLILAPSSMAQTSPTLTVTPSTGLVDPVGDGQFVRLQWTGLPPDLPPVLRQCVANPKNVHDCSQTGLSGPGLITAGNPSPDGSGSAVEQITVGDVNTTISGGHTKDTFTCDYLHPCSVLLFLDEDAVDVHHAVKAPISFAFPPSACPTATGAPAGGVGASAVFRAMLAWEGQTCRSPYRLFVQYTLQSSAIGGADFASGASSFGVVANELPDFQQGLLEGAGVTYTYAPLSSSGLAFGVRLFDRVTDQAITDIKLTPTQVVALFTGQMTWNDPSILALNPQYVDADGIGTLPQIVKPVARGDASEDTLQFTTWAWRNARDTWIHAGDGLSNVDHNPFEDGPTTLFPSVANGKPYQAQGARAVAREVANPSQDPDHANGYIGYMDSSWAAAYGLATVDVQNPAGRFVGPTAHAIAAGLSHMQIDENGITRVPDSHTDDPAAYPLPTVNYMLVHETATPTFTEDQGTTIAAFLRYVAGPGQRKLPDGYVPLPRSMTKLTLAAADAVPVATGGDGTTVPPSIGPTAPATPVLPTGTPATPTPSASAGAVPVERGPVVPPSVVAASPSHLMVPTLIGTGVAGLMLGPAFAWEDRRLRRRPQRTRRFSLRRRGRHAPGSRPPAEAA
jgi:ABC-type phosphate transport system substrate-binding protein